MKNPNQVDLILWLTCAPSPLGIPTPFVVVVVVVVLLILVLVLVVQSDSPPNDKNLVHTNNIEFFNKKIQTQHLHASLFSEARVEKDLKPPQVFLLRDPVLQKISLLHFPQCLRLSIFRNSLMLECWTCASQLNQLRQSIIIHQIYVLIQFQQTCP